jgi:ABC-type methionine transport system permease subunit
MVVVVIASASGATRQRAGLLRDPVLLFLLMVATVITACYLLGLGDVAIRYGYQRYETSITVATVVVLVVLVQLLQFAGDRAARRLSHA